MKISTSILSSNNRIETIKKLNNTNTDYIHIDVMDGLFVDNNQLQPNEINELNKHSQKPFDIHLMVNDPIKYINKINLTNIEYITIHIEIDKNINEIIKTIKSYGIKAGLSLKPNTNINKISKYINDIDLILIMSVEPGYGGQKFIDTTPEKINQIKKINNNIIIEVDGGINDKTINKIKTNTDISVVGSYIINQDDYKKAINTLKN